MAVLEQNEMNDDDPDAKLFWEALGGKPEGGIPETSAEEASADDAASAAQQSANAKIWHVRFEGGGSPTVKELSQRPLSKKMLLSDDTFVLELSSAVWVWIGSKANKEEHRAAMKQAGDLMDSEPKKPDWCDTRSEARPAVALSLSLSSSLSLPHHHLPSLLPSKPPYCYPRRRVPVGFL